MQGLLYSTHEACQDERYHGGWHFERRGKNWHAQTAEELSVVPTAHKEK